MVCGPAVYKEMTRDSSSPAARLAHNQEVVGSNPTPATKGAYSNRFLLKIF